MTRGVVIGKFYPPHKGHKYLIDTASSQCDNLAVIVCGKEGEVISPQLRYEWIKEIHPNVNVILINDIYPAEDSKLWAEKTVEWLGYKPELVFTSEDYGDQYSKHMGAMHVMVDRYRNKYPVSGTLVRENPFAQWDFLEGCVKSYFTKRVVCIGAESSGTTTLSQDLAKHFNTSWVPEYGRYYSEGRQFLKNSSTWESIEFEIIAEMQNKSEDALAKISNKILICDTDSFATSIWHERYLGYKSDRVLGITKDRKYDLYLLTDVDIPFVQDGTRDGEHLRIWMHQRFREELEQYGKRYVVISGNREKRLNDSIKEIEKVCGVL